MFRRLLLLVLVLLCLGCRGERGAKVTGTIVARGEPISVAEKDVVFLDFVPKQRDETDVKANPGAEFKRADASFQFVGAGGGLVPAGEYKICLTVRPREGSDRFSGQFSLDETPLSYTVTEEPVQQIVIDVETKTVTRK